MVHTQVRTTIKVKNPQHVAFWCIKNVGARLFYLHNKQGGIGWKLFRNGDGWELELEDSKMMTMMILSIGDSI